MWQKVCTSIHSSAFGLTKKCIYTYNMFYCVWQVQTCVEPKEIRLNCCMGFWNRKMYMHRKRIMIIELIFLYRSELITTIMLQKKKHFHIPRICKFGWQHQTMSKRTNFTKTNTKTTWSYPEISYNIIGNKNKLYTSNRLFEKLQFLQTKQLFTRAVLIFYTKIQK